MTDPGARSHASEVRIRAAVTDDEAAVIGLAGAALGWRDGEPNAELFAWKHRRNPFGPSPMWVATIEGRIVGFRTFLRWRWRTRTGATLDAVRAVDTATHPDATGRGVFTALTQHALAELEAAGTAFVFNTPNDQSRPGYLKMGWKDLGRVPVGVRVRTPAAAVRTARARVPAAKWSLDTTVGEPAEHALADADAVSALLDRLRAPTGLRTALDADVLRWRYAEGPLRYRVLRRGDALEDGIAVFRLRSRGPAVEATVCDVLVPAGDRFGAHALLRRISRAARPDYLIRAQRDVLGPGWVVRLPGQGPRLTWKAVCDPTEPDLARWELRLGDIELF